MKYFFLITSLICFNSHATTNNTLQKIDSYPVPNHKIPGHFIQVSYFAYASADSISLQQKTSAFHKAYTEFKTQHPDIESNITPNSIEIVFQNQSQTTFRLSAATNLQDLPHYRFFGAFDNQTQALTTLENLFYKN